MANLEVLALDTVTPQIRAPGAGDGYSVPRDMTLASGTTLTAPTVNATTVDATNVEVTNVKAKDGTAAIVLQDVTGNVGIGGTASSGTRLLAAASSTATANYYDGARVVFQNTSATNNNFVDLSFVSANGNDYAAIWGICSAHTAGATTGSLVFGTTNAGAAATERMRIDSAGRVAIGQTTNSDTALLVNSQITSGVNQYQIRQYTTVQSNITGQFFGFQSGAVTAASAFTLNTYNHFTAAQGTIGAGSAITNQIGFHAQSTLTGATNNYGFYSNIASGSNRWNFYAAGTAQNYFAGATTFGTTSTNPVGGNVVGTIIGANGTLGITRDSEAALLVNRKTNDGDLVQFFQDGVLEGSISVAGNTISYNPFMGSHYTEIVGAMPTLKGTVLESLDELVNGKYSNQDRLPKAKISDTVGSSAVYGVYFAPDSDPDTNDGVLAAALGASWVRIAAGVTVQRGDLLESNGDGCAKVQSDDIIRSKTIGKVTSTTVADTYADGSYIVPCVLYCG